MPLSSANCSPRRMSSVMQADVATWRFGVKPMNFSGAREKESASAAQCLHSPSYSTTAGQVHDQSSTVSSSGDR